MNHAQGVSPPLNFFLNVLFRHKKKALLAFLIFCSLALFITLFFPRVFASSAKAYVRIGRESISLDPTATTGQTVTMAKSQETEINSVLDIFGSRRIKKAVVHQIGVNEILETDRPKNFVLAGIKSARSAVSALLDNFSPSVEGDPTDASIPTVKEERAIKRLASQTSVVAGKNSNVITITSKAGTPRLAQSIAQATLDAFIQEHLRLNRTEGSFDFFLEQMNQTKQQLADKQDQIQKLKSRYQLLSVEGKRVALEDKLRNIELAAVNADRELTFAHAKIQNLERATAQVDKEIVTESESGIEGAAYAGMRGQLYQLEIREGELRQIYVDTHPEVVAVQEQRKALAKVLDREPEIRTAITTAINPTWQAINLTLEEQRVDALALEAQRALLVKQLQEAQSELVTLNTREVEIAALQREVDLTEASYGIHSEKLEQARIDAELGSKDISSVNVVQRASYIRKPTSPKKWRVLPAGFVLGILAALGVALLAEYLDPTVRTTEQAEAALGLPVLMTIPRSSRFECELSMKGVRHGSS